MAPLVVIVGETATGKSALALMLAQRFNGEIICADSRTIYKGMHIGTAKPSLLDRHFVPHHLLDIVEPHEKFTAADFKKHSLRLIEDISARGKVPFLVGGSGLYVDAMLYDYTFAGRADLSRRAELDKLTIPELQKLLRKKKIPLPENKLNKRYLIRALETGGTRKDPTRLREHTIVLGTRLPQHELQQRVIERVDAMFEAGLEPEVQQLVSRYGWESEAMKSVGYREFADYLEGSQTLEETREKIIQATMQLAKKQRTWFKRNSGIHWPQYPRDFVELLEDFLNKYQ